MLSANESLINLTSQQQYRGLLERVVFSTVTTVPCCVFLFINGTMLFTLRSKPLFRDTFRYIFLYNLLFADTVQMALSQLLYVIAACQIRLTFPVCGVLSMLVTLTTDISPLTLVVMSLERFIAVCYPLRHATIITFRKTRVVIFVVWAFSSINVFTRVLLLLQFHFEDLPSLVMTEFCSDIALLTVSASVLYSKAHTIFLFISAGSTITFSYTAVMLVARSAPTDKASACKSRNTLLLHLMQLGLSLSFNIYNPMLTALSGILSTVVIVRISIMLYLCLCIFPRCLSSLIYGVRDNSVRPVLMYYLCFHHYH